MSNNKAICSFTICVS